MHLSRWLGWGVRWMKYHRKHIEETPGEGKRPLQSPGADAGTGAQINSGSSLLLLGTALLADLSSCADGKNFYNTELTPTWRTGCEGERWGGYVPLEKKASKSDPMLSLKHAGCIGWVLLNGVEPSPWDLKRVWGWGQWRENDWGLQTANYCYKGSCLNNKQNQKREKKTY